MLTYGDAVGNIDINELLKFHLQNGKIGTNIRIQFRTEQRRFRCEPRWKGKCFS